MTINIRPLHDRVLVEPIKDIEKKHGSIIIPETVKEKPQYGKVVAVGNGRRDEDGAIHALDVKVGDTVLFGKWGGTEITVGGCDYLIMKESDIMAIVV